MFKTTRYFKVILKHKQAEYLKRKQFQKIYLNSCQMFMLINYRKRKTKTQFVATSTESQVNKNL